MKRKPRQVRPPRARRNAPPTRAIAPSNAKAATEMVKALFDAGAPAGMLRYLTVEFRRLRSADAEEVVAQALAEIYVMARRGAAVRRPQVLLLKIARSRAIDALRHRTRVTGLDEDATNILAKVEPGWLRGVDRPDDDALAEEARRDAYEERRKKAIEQARSLLPRLGPSQAKVLAYVLDALEAGQLDVSNEEIGEALGMDSPAVSTHLSRAFARVERLVVELGLLDRHELHTLRDELPPMPTEDEAENKTNDPTGDSQ